MRICGNIFRICTLILSQRDVIKAVLCRSLSNSGKTMPKRCQALNTELRLIELLFMYIVVPNESSCFWSNFHFHQTLTHFPLRGCLYKGLQRMATIELIIFLSDHRRNGSLCKNLGYFRSFMWTEERLHQTNHILLAKGTEESLLSADLPVFFICFTFV